MSKLKREKVIPYCLIVIALIIAFINLGQRAQLEGQRKESQLILDWTQISDYTRRANITIAEGLYMFAPYSGGVLIKEPLLSELQNQGRLLIRQGELMKWDVQSRFEEPVEINPQHTYLIFDDEAELQRVLKHLRAKAPNATTQVFPLEGHNVISTNMVYSELLSTGVGFPKDWLDTIKGEGLGIAVQVRSWTGFNPEGVEAFKSDLEGYDILAFSFNDSDLPGVFLSAQEFKEACQAWADCINSLGSSLFTTEFFAQNGMAAMAALMDQNVLRMHPISEREMQVTLTKEGAVDRYQLAASERNMKLLLVRFIPHVSLEDNLQFFVEINQALADKGLTVKSPQTPGHVLPSNLSLVIISAGILAGAWLLARRFRLSLKLSTILAVLGFLLAVALIFSGRVSLYQKLFPLLSVTVFPTLAIITLTPKVPLGAGKAVLRFLLTTLISLIGAVLMVGVLADGNYMLGLKIFSGVKLAHILPIVLVAFWFYLLKDSQDPVLKTHSALNFDIKVRHLIACAIVVAILGVYLLRTGNDNLALSDWEKSFRAIMDRILYVRPRTKEFAFGHPLLFLVFYYGYKNKLLPILALGMIGQVSLVNTFAHIHTPLLISLLRTVNGLILGIIAGFALIFVLKVIARAWNSFIRKKPANYVNEMLD